MKRRSRFSDYEYDRPRERDFEYDSFAPSAQSAKPKKGFFNFSSFTIAILTGVFILGIGIGMAFASVSNNTNNGKIVTLSDLETKAPNAELCVQYGASAMVMDMRLFVTLSPLNFYASQPVARPGCVLRSNNWSVIEQRNLVSSDQVRDCKRRLNTFGFTGRLEDQPEIDCVYQNDAAKNMFLDQPGSGGTVPAPENERF